MILKGYQRADFAGLAGLLLDAGKDTRVEIVDVRGTIASDLYGALDEMDAIAAGTRCTQPFYHLSIDPPAPLPGDQYMPAIDFIEKVLGLSGQPRQIVVWTTGDTVRYHVVWSRIDLNHMRAIPMSHDRYKLRSCARVLARAYGLPLPEGLSRNRAGIRRDEAIEALWRDR